MWLTWKKDSFQNVAVHHKGCWEKLVFRQANTMLMADVSVCHRDKDGASAFIYLYHVKCWCIHSASTQAMLLLNLQRQHHAFSNSFIMTVLNSFFSHWQPISDARQRWWKPVFGGKVYVMYKPVKACQAFEIVLLFSDTAGHCSVTGKRRRAPSKACSQRTLCHELCK